VTRYIWFREPKPLKTWECRQVMAHGKVVISGRTIQAIIGATISYAVFFSRGLDDGRNGEAGTIRYIFSIHIVHT
jgi:hypothetical protein